MVKFGNPLSPMLLNTNCSSMLCFSIGLNGNKQMDRQTDEHDQIINFVANVVNYQNIITNRCTVQSGTMAMRQLLQYSYYSLYPQIWNQIKSNQVYGKKD